MKKNIRVLIAKVGFDGHDRGAKILTLGLRDKGMEVIYTGLRQTPEKIAETALQEDVDVVGVSLLSGAHRTLFPRVVRCLKERGMEDVLVIGGGLIPGKDVEYLKAEGISEIFGQGTKVSDVAHYIRKSIEQVSA